VFWALRLKGPALGAVPVLEAWYERVGSRPAVAKVAAEIIAADRELSPDLYA
jgi:glutathione S-transferase